MCKVLRVSRSGYYAWRRRPEPERRRTDRRLVHEIRDVHRTSRWTYGSPRVHAELRARKFRVGRNRVARLMKENGIRARRKRRFRRTTDSRHSLPVARNLVRRKFEAPAPNRIWAGDITYLWTSEGWMYLAVILDLFSRRVVGWATASHLKTDLTLEALEAAIVTRLPGAGLVHHSDRGIQYASGRYRAVLASRGITCSMSRKGDCWDNAVVESFFGTLETELVPDDGWTTRAEARRELFDYIEIFYNRQRRHSYLGYVSPASFEEEAGRKGLAPARPAAA
jgi:transposase InsO family protein